MEVKFFTDEHIANAVVRGLRDSGVDVLSIREAGRSGLPDDAQLEFATAAGRVMVTNDSDFLVLHDSGVDHAGIAFVTRQNLPIGDIIEFLELIHGALDAGEMRSHVEFV